MDDHMQIMTFAGWPHEFRVGDEFGFTFRRGFTDQVFLPGQRGSFDLPHDDQRIHFVITPEGKARVVNIESPIPPPDDDEEGA